MKKLTLDGMLTVRQVATFMNVSVSTVRRWSDKGMLKCYHVGSRRDRRYRRRDILDFFKRHTRHLCIDENQEMSPHRGGHRRSLYLN